MGCLKFVLVVFFAICFDALLALICQQLWNYLAPLFWAGAPILTYLQAFGVLVFVLIVTAFFRTSK